MKVPLEWLSKLWRRQTPEVQLGIGILVMLVGAAGALEVSPKLLEILNGLLQETTP